jgi:ribosome recycling factor
VKRTRADKKSNKPQLSTEAQTQAKTLTSTVVPPSFTKQQRKEVQQAIERGMASVKAQASSKKREQDKKIKHLQKQLAAQNDDAVTVSHTSHNKGQSKALVPWALLGLTWIGLAVYLWAYA